MLMQFFRKICFLTHHLEGKCDIVYCILFSFIGYLHDFRPVLTFRRSGARRLGDRDRVSNSANDSSSSDRNSGPIDRDSFTRWRDRHCYGQQQHRQRQQWLEGALRDSAWDKDTGNY